MSSEIRFGRPQAATAFTLIELLLTVALVLLFAGAIILNFGSLDGNTRLEEGASQVETLFRYARAQAANTGRQVRIVFGSPAPMMALLGSSTNQASSLGSTNSGVFVLWEPDPVDAPGRFESLPGAELLVEQINDLVKVREVGQPGMFQSQTNSFDGAALAPQFDPGSTNDVQRADGGTNSTPPLSCYPDGSSDSMEVVLAAANGEDKRLAIVTLSGMAGTSRHRLVTPTTDGIWPSDNDGQVEPGQDR